MLFSNEQKYFENSVVFIYISKPNIELTEKGKAMLEHNFKDTLSP